MPIPKSVRPEVKGQIFPTPKVSPVPELPGACLRPSLRPHYSLVSPSTFSCFLPFPSFPFLPSKALIPYQSFTHPHIRAHTVGKHVCDTTEVRFSKSTFSFMKMPFRSLRVLCVLCSDWLCLVSLL